MNRETLPKKIKEALLDEYDHRCAVCGGDRPHLHHIDEDSSHNELHNLLPLCPNCHLRDQHNPTRKIDIPKLRLFRKYKDPAILRPQFHPIYLRQAFLDDVSQSEEPVRDLERQAEELIEFVQSLEMGEFYGKRLEEQIAPLRRMTVISLGGGQNSRWEVERRQGNRDYRAKLIANRQASQYLLVELLRYQSWANA